MSTSSADELQIVAGGLTMQEGAADLAPLPGIPIESVPLPEALLSPHGERSLETIVPVYRVGVAVLLCCVIFKLGDLLSSLLSPAYTKFTSAEKIRWNLRYSLCFRSTDRCAR